LDEYQRDGGSGGGIMNLNGKSILVTGGTGFIGARLVEKLILEHQARVRVLVRNFARVPRIARFPIEMKAGDLLDAASVQRAAAGCEAVFHCAYDFEGSAEQQTQISVQGTRNVCEAVLKESVSRLVHVSTFAVYSPAPSGDLDESSPWPESKKTYVLAKRAAERLVMNLHKKEHLPVAVIQPTMVYGPYSPHWTIGPVQAIKTGLMPLVNGGGGFCNAVYIDDLVDAMILAATRQEAVGEAFLVSAAEPVTWKVFYGAFEKILAMPATVEVSSDDLWQQVKKGMVRPGAMKRLSNLVRRPDVYAELAGIPPVLLMLRTVRKCLSDNSWNSLKASFFRNATSSKKQPRPRSRSINVPDDGLMAMYVSKTRVRIDKARTRLGYGPKFGFEQGMELASNYIRWANLA
jgi:nucleoside-diphosphate-sugar epimerase